MSYQTYDFNADVKKGGAKYDTEIKKLQGDAKKKSELAKLQAERSKAIGDILNESMKAILKAGTTVYFPKIDAWLGQAEGYIKTAKDELEKMRTGRGSALSVEMVNGGTGLIKSLAEMAQKENLAFGSAWATYRTGNAGQAGVQPAHFAILSSSRTQLMSDSKAVVAKAEKIKELVKQAEVLGRTAKNLAGAALRDEGDAIADAKETAENVAQELDELEKTAHSASNRCGTIKKTAADSKATAEALKLMAGFWKDIVAAHTQVKNQLKTIHTMVKQAPDQVGAAYLGVAKVKEELQKAAAAQKKATDAVAALAAEVQEASKDMAVINKRLSEM